MPVELEKLFALKVPSAGIAKVSVEPPTIEPKKLFALKTPSAGSAKVGPGEPGNVELKKFFALKAPSAGAAKVGGVGEPGGSPAKRSSE